MTLKRAAAAALVVLLVPTLACANPIRYASQDDPQTLDPHSANLLSTSRVTSQIYDPLVWRDKDWKVIPWLALSWTQVNERTWRFKLRDGVKFHDGTPFTAEDVVFSTQRALDPQSQMRTAIQGVDSARAIDPLTVEFILKEPNPALLQHFTQFRIMSKAWCVKNRSQRPQNYKEKEDTFAARNTNGTGPFMLVERSPDVKTVLAAFPDWWGRKSGDWQSNLTRVEMLPIKSQATRLAALLSGEIDLLIDPATQDVARLRAQPELKIIQGAEMRVQYLAFDLFRDTLLYGDAGGKNPFKDLRVRQAVALAIDVEAIKSKVMRGMSLPVGSIVTNLVEGYSRDADVRMAPDIERARKLVIEAGYPKGFDVTLDCGSNQPAADICQAVAPMLTRVGIRTKPNIVPFANYFPKVETYDTSFYLLSWGGGVTSDALYTLNALLHTVGPKGEGDFNMGRWSNATMDSLIARIKVEGNPATRNAAIREALLLNNRELPTIPLHQPLIPWAMKKNVTATFSPVNTVYFYKVRVD